MVMLSPKTQLLCLSTMLNKKDVSKFVPEDFAKRTGVGYTVWDKNIGGLVDLQYFWSLKKDTRTFHFLKMSPLTKF